MIYVKRQFEVTQFTLLGKERRFCHPHRGESARNTDAHEEILHPPSRPPPHI